MADVKSAFNSKEIQKKTDESLDVNGEGLFTRRKFEKKESKNSGNQSNNNNQTKSRFKIGKKCFYCQKEGHFRDECRALKAKLSRDQGKNNGNADIFSLDYTSADVLVVSSEAYDEEWIMDSGCSFHMCPKKEMFSVFKEVSGGIVLLGDNKACNVLGIGSVVITMFDGISRTLQNVRYVPDLRINLLSIGMLDNIGCTIKVEGGTLIIHKGSTGDERKIKEWDLVLNWQDCYWKDCTSLNNQRHK